MSSPFAQSLLVVDDHPVYRAGIAALCASAGYLVVGEAASEAEAVSLARTFAPHLVLMDLGLPDGSGITATARIMGERPATRIIVVTMYDDDGSVRQALAAGAAGYLVKDAAHAEILAVVDAVAHGATALGSGLSAWTSTVARVPTTPLPFRLTPPGKRTCST